MALVLITSGVTISFLFLDLHYSILTPLVYTTTQILNIGTSQLPLEAALQVNVFGEASFGVLL